MTLTNDVRIAGDKTVGDWFELRPRLLLGANSGVWQEAFDGFFKGRLESRYFEPIKALQKLPTNGVGFSIVAIQCSLIEFLHATRKGLKYVVRNPDPNKFEYSRSKEMFVEFLTSTDPFDKIFSCKGKHHAFSCHCKAEDFYEGVRCGLLHEARTKKGWKIQVQAGAPPCIDFDKRIVYRDQLQDFFRLYVDAYGAELASDRTLQEAFIRKFDDMCSE